MSFTITITCPDRELGPLLVRLGTTKYDLKHMADKVANGEAAPPKVAKKKKRGSAKSLLSMTGKEAKSSTLLAGAREVFEKLEADGGIGTISLGQFREALLKKGSDPKLPTRMLTEGYLKYL